MSLLSRPRLHFRGTFKTNVDTANNDDIVRPIDVAAVTVNTGGMSDAEFICWMEQTIPRGNPPRPTLRASWNYYGDNGCEFERCAIIRADLPDGRDVTSAQDDAVIGLEVLFGAPRQRNTALMVDLDPEGVVATQIFADFVRLAPSGGEPVLRGAPTVAHSRWLNFSRNLGLGGFTGASAVWQMSFPVEELEIVAGVSPALDALRTASARRGLVMRFCTYALAPRVTDHQALADRFRDGHKDQNPAVGIVAGTIGVWEENELASASAGRRLYPAATLSFDHASVPFAPAVARVERERNVVALDLITAFPEADASFTKVDLGRVFLAVASRGAGGEELIPLGDVDYGRASYEGGSGVVEVPFDPGLAEAAESGELRLVHADSGTPLLREVEVFAESDDRDVYLQEGEEREVGIRFFRKGTDPGTPIAAPIHEFVTTNKAQSDVPTPPAQHIVSVPAQIQCDPNGQARLLLRAKVPGTCVITFEPGQSEPSFDPLLSAFLNVRVLPRDDYSQMPDSALTFDFIYREVLRYYHLIYPAMSLRFALNDEDAVRDQAESILERIDKSAWSTWSYMPRTRDMSDGKRELLARWCRLQTT